VLRIDGPLPVGVTPAGGTDANVVLGRQRSTP
jgi:hypothetical protein